MATRVLLVRHGRSAHRARGWLDAAGVRAWFEAYDAAGILPEDEPPPALRALVAEAGLVVGSDLPRARASAERLAPDAPVLLTPLLRELPLELPALGGARLPLAAWALAAGAHWAYRTMRGRAPATAALERAAAAADWLAALADRHDTVVAVTHASLRGQIAAALRAADWACEVGRRRWAHWSVWTLTRGTPARGTLPH
jgi:broad specificity phosphatase PhoE